jgi:hypothetical protein
VPDKGFVVKDMSVLVGGVAEDIGYRRIGEGFASEVTYLALIYHAFEEDVVASRERKFGHQPAGKVISDNVFRLHETLLVVIKKLVVERIGTEVSVDGYGKDTFAGKDVLTEP